MDKLFVAEKGYLDDTRSTTSAILRAVLCDALPKRLDAIEIRDSLPSSDEIIALGKDAVPLGDLKWCRDWLSALEREGEKVADPQMTPIEIPDAMLPFAGREYMWRRGEDIKGTPYVNSRLFVIKDVDHLKAFNSLVYDGDISHLLDDDTTYSISEKVLFLSEWRVFVYEDEIRGAYNYLGDPMVFPDPETVYDMVRAYKDDLLRPHPRAYTLDVGVISKPEDVRANAAGHVTAPIEVHPFVACGLYGFAEPVLADMLVAGFEWYRDEARWDWREREQETI